MGIGKLKNNNQRTILAYYDVERDYRLPYHASDLKEALQRLNPMLSAEVLNLWITSHSWKREGS